jgi:hypothetical protein
MNNIQWLESKEMQAFNDRMTKNLEIRQAKSAEMMKKMGYTK